MQRRANGTDFMKVLSLKIHKGDKLLTTDNPGKSHDAELFERLGIRPE